jgi:hypothetical protein
MSGGKTDSSEATKAAQEAQQQQAAAAHAAAAQAAAAQSGAAAPAVADPACPKSGATGQLGTLELMKSAATKAALSMAARELKVEEVNLPAPIDNVCLAQKRLAYVGRATSRWSVNVIDSIQQAKEALDLKQEIDSYQAFKSTPDFGKASDKDIARLRKDMKHDLQEIEAAIKGKRKVNVEVLAAAQANMRAALVNGGLIGGWDKRLIEFMSDNGKWAYDNARSVKLFADHVGLLGSTVRSMNTVIEAQSASNGPATNDKKAAAIMKQREQETLAFEKQVASELKL